jgi:hypothetical protein
MLEVVGSHPYEDTDPNTTTLGWAYNNGGGQAEAANDLMLRLAAVLQAKEERS